MRSSARVLIGEQERREERMRAQVVRSKPVNAPTLGPGITGVERIACNNRTTRILSRTAHRDTSALHLHLPLDLVLRHNVELRGLSWITGWRPCLYDINLVDSGTPQHDDVGGETRATGRHRAQMVTLWARNPDRTNAQGL